MSARLCRLFHHQPVFAKYAGFALAPAWRCAPIAAQSIERAAATASGPKPAGSTDAKVAPDLSSDDIAQIAEQVVACAFDGVIATNTTLSREAVAEHPHAMETGGLSGQPLADRSVEVVRQLRSVLPEDMALVGVGGIGTESQARDMLQAGAQALQIYTSFIYNGPKMVHKLVAATN